MSNKKSTRIQNRKTWDDDTADNVLAMQALRHKFDPTQLTSKKNLAVGVMAH